LRLAMHRVYRTEIILLLLGLTGLLSAGCPHKGAGQLAEDVRSARALTKAGHAKAAFEAFERLVWQDPSDLTAHRGLIEAAYYAGRLDEVEGQYERKSRSKDAGLGHYGLALVAAARGPGHMQAALDRFARAAEAMPQEADVPYRVGKVYLLDGRPGDAKLAFEAALALDPERVDVRIALGACLQQAGDGKGAIEIMRSVAGKPLSQADASRAMAVSARVYDPHQDLPIEVSAEINRAADLLGRDAAQPALTIVNDLAVRFPAVAFVHTLKGLANARLGNSGEAIVAFERSLQLHPDNPLALVGLGDVYLAVEKWSKARTYYDRAIVLDPFYLDPHQRLGEMAMNLGDLDRAVRSYQMVVSLKPNSVEDRHVLAQMLFRAGRYAEVVGAFEELLRISKDDLKALMSLARVHMVLAEKEPSDRKRHRNRATELLEQALELAPENNIVAEMLASLED
jgi:tetratricopeptide (TPR) repeat protein